MIVKTRARTTSARGERLRGDRSTRDERASATARVMSTRKEREKLEAQEQKRLEKEAKKAALAAKRAARDEARAAKAEAKVEKDAPWEGGEGKSVTSKDGTWSERKLCLIEGLRARRGRASSDSVTSEEARGKRSRRSSMGRARWSVVNSIACSWRG